jgi:hypothetical protein
MNTEEIREQLLQDLMDKRIEEYLINYTKGKAEQDPFWSKAIVNPGQVLYYLSRKEIVDSLLDKYDIKLKEK